MSKYHIKLKRDFGPHGFLINGKQIHRGFVVVKDGCNCMPGATWFLTEADAMLAIEVLETVGLANFWAVLARKRAVVLTSRI